MTGFDTLPSPKTGPLQVRSSPVQQLTNSTGLTCSVCCQYFSQSTLQRIERAAKLKYDAQVNIAESESNIEQTAEQITTSLDTANSALVNKVNDLRNLQELLQHELIEMDIEVQRLHKELQNVVRALTCKSMLHAVAIC